MKDIQNTITLFCGKHGLNRTFPMTFNKENGGYYCEEKACENSLSKEDYAQLLHDIQMKIYQNNQFFESNLTGIRWRSYGIDYVILKHKNDNIDILVWNHKGESKCEL